MGDNRALPTPALPEDEGWDDATLVIGIPALFGGWYLVRNRVRAAAEEAAGHTADVSATEDVPVVANPAADPDD
jgi:L-asparagine permease